MSKPLSYCTAVITYIDILGFQNLLDSETPGRLSKMLRLLREAHQPSPEIKKLDRIEFQAFSDLVVRYCPIDSPTNVSNPTGSLFSEILSLVYAQTELISQGM
jgi:hypothetical protein